jgi:hypothetical protein
VNNRDTDADYKAALIQEYEGYSRAGRDDDAAHVASVLRDQYDHEVEDKPKRQTAKRAAAPERADQKAPETAVPEKPARKTAEDD